MVLVEAAFFGKSVNINFFLLVKDNQIKATVKLSADL